MKPDPFNDRPSSSGRTTAFEAVNVGSNPTGRSKPFSVRALCLMTPGYSALIVADSQNG